MFSSSARRRRRRPRRAADRRSPRAAARRSAGRSFSADSAICGARAVCGLLHDGDAAGVVNRRRAGRAVLVGAGEDDAQQALAVDLGRRFEQHVDRGPRRCTGSSADSASCGPVVDQQVIVGRREIDGAGLRPAPCPPPRAPAARTFARRSRRAGSACRAAGAARRRPAARSPRAAPAAARSAPRRRRPTRRSRRRRPVPARFTARPAFDRSAPPARNPGRRRRARRSAAIPSRRCRESPCGTMRRGTARARGPAARG